MKVIKSFPNSNGFAFLRALPKAVNSAEIKSNAVNNAKLRYECEERASGSFDSEAENKEETERDVILHRHTKTTKAEASNGLGFRFVGSSPDGNVGNLKRWFQLY